MEYASPWNWYSSDQTWNRHTSHLESVHLAAAHVVVHGASEDVHSVLDDRRRVEEPTGGQLRVGGRHDRGPRLRVQVETGTGRARL